MASSYNASLTTARQVFTLLIMILTTESIRSRTKSQLLSILNTATASSPAELAETVRRAIINMAEQSYNNGLTLGHVDGIVQRIQRDRHI